MASFTQWTNGREFEQTPGDSEGQGSLAVLQFMGSQRAGRDLATEKQKEGLLFMPGTYSSLEK